MLKHVQIAAAIAKRREQLLSKAKISSERILHHLKALTEFDPGRLYDDKGALLPVKEMPDDVRLYLDGIDIDEISKLVSDGKDSKGKPKKTLLSISTAKVKLPKKLAALELAMRHLGELVKDKAGYNPDDESEAPAPVAITIDFKDARRRKA